MEYGLVLVTLNIFLKNGRNKANIKSKIFIFCRNPKSQIPNPKAQSQYGF